MATTFPSLSSPTASVVLANGVKIPIIGFGTYKAKEDDAYDSVLHALKAGYRHIDTAYIYGNETQVGKAIKDSQLPRSEIFITTKLWTKFRNKDEAKKIFAQQLQALGLDYVDLYLLHWPANEKQFGAQAAALNREAWEALVELYQAGKIKAIGVSNFMIHHLQQLGDSPIQPMVNQIEYHPGYQQEELVAYCKDHNIIVEAYSPLGQTRCLTNPALVSLAKQYHVSPAQVALRLCLQDGVVPLPKSVTPSRIEQNLQVFDFTLTSEDLSLIKAQGQFGWSGHDPDQVDW